MAGSEIDEQGVREVTLQDHRRPRSPLVESLLQRPVHAWRCCRLEQLQRGRGRPRERIEGDHLLLALAEGAVQLEQQSDGEGGDADAARALEEDHRSGQPFFGDEVAICERHQRRRRDVERGQEVVEVWPELVADRVDDQAVADDQGETPDREQDEQAEGAEER